MLSPRSSRSENDTLELRSEEFPTSSRPKNEIVEHRKVKCFQDLSNSFRLKPLVCWNK